MSSRETTATPTHERVAATAIASQCGYREHIHREVMLPGEPEFHTSHGETFWPTCREYKRPTLPPVNVRCQRCGRRIRPVSGWWCRRCSRVAAELQCRHGLSMVQIAASGEWDPPECPVTDALAPWLRLVRDPLPIMEFEAQEAFLIRNRVNRPRLTIDGRKRVNYSVASIRQKTRRVKAVV